MRPYIKELMVETTRRCNMSCPHCLRGKPENIDMPFEYQEMFFDRIDGIYVVNFTGGEPSLNSGAILDFIQLCKSKNIEVGSYYISTNAKDITDDFLMAILNLDEFCSDNFISKIHISTDRFHNYDPLKAEHFALQLASCKIAATIDYDPFEADMDYEYLNEGYYAVNYGDGAMFNPKKFVVTKNSHILGEVIYLNCEGNLVAGCGWSYCSQRDKDNIICSVDDHYIEAIERYNERHWEYQIKRGSYYQS